MGVGKSTSCEILLLSPRPAGHFDLFLSKLQTLFEGADFEVSHLSSSASVPEFVAVDSVPHLVICDPGDQGLPTIINGLRALDPGVCVLVLTSQRIPSSAHVMEWLDYGATGLIHEDFEPSEVADSLHEALGRRLSVHLPRKARVPIRHKVQVQIASLEQALVAETLNVGMGGMFIRSVPQNVAVGHEIEFEFQFSRNVGMALSEREDDPVVRKMEADEHASNNLGTVHGSGTVVWVRSKPAGGLPEGMGVQFKDVDPAGLRLIQNFVATHRIRAFIPKS
jgi:hypothetical protein